MRILLLIITIGLMTACAEKKRPLSGNAYQFCEDFLEYSKNEISKRYKKQYEDQMITYKECKRVTATLTEDQKKFSQPCNEPFDMSKFYYKEDNDYLFRCLRIQEPQEVK